MAYTGSGTQADPYLVGTAEDFLNCVATNYGVTASASINLYIKLSADLDFTGKGSKTININGQDSGYNYRRIYIDGDGHGFYNIALINNPLFVKSNSGSTVNTVWYFSNLTIEAMITVNSTNSSYVGNYTQNNSWIFADGCGNLTFNNCTVHFKFYNMIFIASDPLCFYLPLGRDDSYHPIYNQNYDVIYKSNIVIDYYNCGPKSFMCINNKKCNTSYVHRIRDSIIKISYYDENGWALVTNEHDANFLNARDGYRGGGCVSLIDGADQSYQSYNEYKLSIVNSGIFVRYYAETNMNGKVNMGIIKDCKLANTYIVYECKGSVYLYPRLSTCAFETYVFYDADKAPDLYNAYPTWAGGSYQLAALTTAQCKSRLSFEGPDAIIPFKLKQTT